MEKTKTKLGDRLAPEYLMDAYRGVNLHMAGSIKVLQQTAADILSSTSHHKA